MLRTGCGRGCKHRWFVFSHCLCRCHCRCLSVYVAAYPPACLPICPLACLSCLPVCLSSCTQYHNPFEFKHVTVLGGGKSFTDSEPCVMLATPSMLQSGFSRELFEAWAGERHNTVLIVDFAVQGTLARQLLDSPQTITTRDNRPVSQTSIGAATSNDHCHTPKQHPIV